MTVDAVAEAFVAARKAARALSDYPGEVPARLEQSYAIQERAIALWDRPVIGWKIGRLHPDRQAEHGVERLAGPIFAPTFKPYNSPVAVPVFTGGFAAVEAEYVFRVDHDADPGKTEYGEEDALRLIDAVFAGVEMAGSPLKTINVLGPTVVASDFGNNFGLILGERLAGFDSDATVATLGPDAVKAFNARTEIDGKVVGDGGLYTMPGGPLKAIAWLAGHLAARGRPLRRGQLISSGASTGIHEIQAGQSATVAFTGPRNDKKLVLALNTVALTSGAIEIG